MRIAAAGLMAITLTLLIAGTAGLIWLHVQGIKLLSVQTASMVPALKPGDAVIVSPIQTNGLKQGEIVSYQSPLNTDMLVSHRLVKVDPHTGWLTTAGDALDAPDPAFPPRLVVGRASAVLPGFGSVLDALRSPICLAAVIYLPALLITAAETRRLSGIYTRPFYSARL